MTVLSLAKSTVETSASPASRFCFSIMELKPPMVSVSSPDMEPLRSRMKTNSVIKTPPSFDCALIVAQPKEGLVACGATFMLHFAALQFPQPLQPGLDRAGGTAKVRTEVFLFHTAVEQAA